MRLYCQLPRSSIAIVISRPRSLTIILFCNVQYIKKHKIGLKKKIQRNVMTFNVNFYFFILFMFLSLLQNLLKSLAVTEQSGFVESFI